MLPIKSIGKIRLAHRILLVKSDFTRSKPQRLLKTHCIAKTFKFITNRGPQREKNELRYTNKTFLQVSSLDIFFHFHSTLLPTNHRLMNNCVGGSFSEEKTQCIEMYVKLNYRLKDLHSGLLQDSLWSGITTRLYSGDHDQTQTKFFEIWLYGENGKLTIDLGRISEDRDGDGLVDTEDIPEAGMNGNTLLDDGEDIGLDGCLDEYEDGWGGCLEGEETYCEFHQFSSTAGVQGSN